MSASGQGSANIPPPSQTPGLRPPHSWSEARKTAMGQVQQQVNNAIKSAFNPHPSKYKRAIAVLFHFDNDDLGIDPLEKQLGQVFKNYYGYEIRYETLKSKGKPEIGIQDVTRWLHNDGWTGAGNLIILVFSGHGQVQTHGQFDFSKKYHLHIG
jgi:hypothetical protein